MRQRLIMTAAVLMLLVVMPTTAAGQTASQTPSPRRPSTASTAGNTLVHRTSSAGPEAISPAPLSGLIMSPALS